MRYPRAGKDGGQLRYLYELMGTPVGEVYLMVRTGRSARQLSNRVDRYVLRAAATPHDKVAQTSGCKYAENSGQMQPIREQAGTFADSIKLWSGT